MFLKSLANLQKMSYASLPIHLQAEKFIKMYKKYLHLSLVLINYRLKNLSTFIRKRLCCSLVFNKVTSWKNLQNSQESSCARDSFVIKLQDKTQYQHQTVGTLAFFNCADKLQVFLRHLPEVFLLLT